MKLDKKEYISSLLAKVKAAQNTGKTLEEAIESALTLKQYDFLIDNDINIDEELLTVEQKAFVRELRRSPRPLFKDGYNKRYPEEKRNLYENIACYLETLGYTAERQKNFRDLFIIGQEGKKYNVVLIEPRDKKKKKEGKE